ncbi:MAG: PH domain-containing protein [Akkermansia sp.]|nr:PH domain-containing protein [Akkermansia sp.]
MIDFKNGSLFKLSPVDADKVEGRVGPLLVDGERIEAAFKAIRDSVVFTNKRVIAINVQGIMGKKVDFTSLPYSKVQAYSIETAGTFDFDSELDLFFSGIGKVRFELKGSYDIVGLSKLIAGYIL